MPLSRREKAEQHDQLPHACISGSFAPSFSMRCCTGPLPAQRYPSRFGRRVLSAVSTAGDEGKGHLVAGIAFAQAIAPSRGSDPDFREFAALSARFQEYSPIMPGCLGQQWKYGYRFLFVFRCSTTPVRRALRVRGQPGCARTAFALRLPRTPGRARPPGAAPQDPVRPRWNRDHRGARVALQTTQSVRGSQGFRARAHGPLSAQRSGATACGGPTEPATTSLHQATLAVLIARGDPRLRRPRSTNLRAVMTAPPRAASTPPTTIRGLARRHDAPARGNLDTDGANPCSRNWSAPAPTTALEADDGADADVASARHAPGARARAQSRDATPAAPTRRTARARPPPTTHAPIKARQPSHSRIAPPRHPALAPRGRRRAPCCERPLRRPIIPAADANTVAFSTRALGQARAGGH